MSKRALKRQENFNIRVEVESFIRTVYADGDGIIDPRDIPQILKSVAAEFADARDQRAELRGATVDLTLLARRIARAKEPEKRAELMEHVLRIADKVGAKTAVILRSDEA